MRTILALLLINLSLLYWFKRRVRIPKGYKLPPGPKGKFLIGNLLDIPTKKEWQTYRRWGKVYGDLTYLNACGTSILFLNSDKSVSELFEQRAGIYSNRVHSTMFIDLAGWDWTVATMQPNAVWKRNRAIIHQYLNKATVTQYREIFERSARTLLHRLYTTPDKFTEHTRHATGAITMEAVYGIKTLPEDDPYINLADSALRTVAEVATPGAYLVEFLPFLKYIPSWVPGAGFHKIAKRLGTETTAMANLPFDTAKADMKSGTPRFSIVRAFLEEIADKRESENTLATDSENEQLIREIAATIYLAAIDTTESTLHIFYFAMILYPDVQKQAQKELDKVVDHNTLPSLDDRKHLPYIEALCQEVLRWHPVTPLAFPHMLKEDDIIGEYFVPKGTVVFGNSWSLCNSESVYGSDLDKFDPGRFLKPNAKYPDNAFGFGRRICPGRYFADAMLFTMITHILHTFDIAPYEGPAGPELPDIDGFTLGVLSRPHPFECKFTLRPSRAKTFMEESSMNT